jgi:hypothetical protein
MLRLCGYRSGYCRSVDPCSLAGPDFPSTADWHVLAGLAAECVHHVSRESQVEIRRRCPVVIHRTKRRADPQGRLLP